MSSSCATKKPSAVEKPATRQSCSPLKLARSPTTGRRKFPGYWQSVPTNEAQPTPQARARVASCTVARGRSTAARPVVMPIQKRRPQPVPTRVMATPKDRSASTQPSRKNCQDGEGKKERRKETEGGDGRRGRKEETEGGDGGGDGGRRRKDERKMETKITSMLVQRNSVYTLFTLYTIHYILILHTYDMHFTLRARMPL